MNTNTASLLRKLALCLSASVLTLTANATVTNIGYWRGGENDSPFVCFILQYRGAAMAANILGSPRTS